MFQPLVVDVPRLIFPSDPDAELKLLGGAGGLCFQVKSFHYVDFPGAPHLLQLAPFGSPPPTFSFLCRPTRNIKTSNDSASVFPPTLIRPAGDKHRPPVCSGSAASSQKAAGQPAATPGLSP